MDSKNDIHKCNKIIEWADAADKLIAAEPPTAMEHDGVGILLLNHLSEITEAKALAVKKDIEDAENKLNKVFNSQLVQKLGFVPKEIPNYVFIR